ncbi:MAG: transposase [Candidatus Muproteobacteria bacterium RBG_16_62_13]|uniref:Transposase n=1 Tax=Candidatus Muproteobacteria bacterium RBG_16_62_13 TaxID=1817756 RepID=A0A1F6T535_9PROT|nr:MAG: transposase [Candidatus Muproteobacteria bacterium RBG_16_62_13]
MPDYHRYRVPGGCYFFTVNLLERAPNDLLIRHIDLLRAAVREVRGRWPFVIDGWVVLPDHLHGIWTLPPGDSDFTNRWRLIKAGFSRQLPKIEWRSSARASRGERGIWQRRFWEHAIRDERDFRNHMDYLHFNPVKHGHVRRVADWPHSSFARCVEKGVYPCDWGGTGLDNDLETGEHN